MLLRFIFFIGNAFKPQRKSKPSCRNPSLVSVAVEVIAVICSHVFPGVESASHSWHHWACSHQDEVFRKSLFEDRMMVQGALCGLSVQ